VVAGFRGRSHGIFVTAVDERNRFARIVKRDVEHRNTAALPVDAETHDMFARKRGR
jgi:hypothetical protein